MITKVLNTALLALMVSLLPQSAFSAQKVTAGASCKSLNAKAAVKNKTYTCIKKGTKLVWNKGVLRDIIKCSVLHYLSPFVSLPLYLQIVLYLYLIPDLVYDLYCLYLHSYTPASAGCIAVIGNNDNANVITILFI